MANERTTFKRRHDEQTRSVVSPTISSAACILLIHLHLILLLQLVSSAPVQLSLLEDVECTRGAWRVNNSVVSQECVFSLSAGRDVLPSVMVGLLDGTGVRCCATEIIQVTVTLKKRGQAKPLTGKPIQTTTAGKRLRLLRPCRAMLGTDIENGDSGQCGAVVRHSAAGQS